MRWSFDNVIVLQMKSGRSNFSQHLLRLRNLPVNLANFFLRVSPTLIRVISISSGWDAVAWRWQGKIFSATVPWVSEILRCKMNLHLKSSFLNCFSVSLGRVDENEIHLTCEVTLAGWREHIGKTCKEANSWNSSVCCQERKVYSKNALTKFLRLLSIESCCCHGCISGSNYATTKPTDLVS